VFEPIKLVILETTPGGALLRPDVGGRTFYQDPFAAGDVRCLYDPSTKTFYFTEIGFPVATTAPTSPKATSSADRVV
jgi:hypothetical protein